MSSTTPDEFDAVRTIVNTLEAFGPEDQTRILRWAAEKLGLSPSQRSTGQSTAAPPSAPQSDARTTGPIDIRSFVNSKKPKNDSQFVAVVAYYYRFDALEKKDSIKQADLLEACRKVNHPRPPAPGQTLRNAVTAGLLDRAGRGEYSINSVGENLVTVTLPGDNTSPDVAASVRKPRKRSRTVKTSAKKKSPA